MHNLILVVNLILLLISIKVFDWEVIILEGRKGAKVSFMDGMLMSLFRPAPQISVLKA